jgi:hypothetical protein
MKREHVIERQGVQMVLYDGLLDEAHQQGLCRVSTTLLQAPTPENGMLCIVYAVVETSKGTFGGIGDATPENAGPVKLHFIRMAETRAKARAMRDAVNIGMVTFEETGLAEHGPMDAGGWDDESPTLGPPRPDQIPTPQTEGAPAWRDPNKPATAGQIETIRKLSNYAGSEGDIIPDGLTRAEASERISDLSTQLNQKGK